MDLGDAVDKEGGGLLVEGGYEDELPIEVGFFWVERDAERCLEIHEHDGLVLDVDDSDCSCGGLSDSCDLDAGSGENALNFRDVYPVADVAEEEFDEFDLVCSGFE